jgi:hypothetical protein
MIYLLKNKPLFKVMLLTALLTGIASFPMYAEGNDNYGIQQQSGKRITGTVVDQTGESIIGANVVEKGTSNGIATDVDGNFMLTVPSNAVLQISYLGYFTQEVSVGNQTSLKITLKEDMLGLDEVVVVGYGTQKKADLTSAISILSPTEVLKAPGGIESALQGNVAGVNVSGGKIRIRGTSSITGNTDPLWVVDGIIGGSVPNDDEIETIQVLKDGLTQAILTSRQARNSLLYRVYRCYGNFLLQNLTRPRSTRKRATWRYICPTGSLMYCSKSSMGRCNLRHRFAPSDMPSWASTNRISTSTAIWATR